MRVGCRCGVRRFRARCAAVSPGKFFWARDLFGGVSGRRHKPMKASGMRHKPPKAGHTRPLSHPNTPSPRSPIPPKNVTEPCSIVPPKATVRKNGAHGIEHSVACDNNLFILVMPTLRIHACVCPARRNRERLQVAAHMRCSNARAAARTSPPSVDIMFVPVRRWTTATLNSIHCGHRIDAGPVACDAAAGDAADGAARTRRRPLVSVRQRLLAAAVVDSGWLRRRRPHRRPLAAA